MHLPLKRDGIESEESIRVTIYMKTHDLAVEIYTATDDCIVSS